MKSSRYLDPYASIAWQLTGAFLVGLAAALTVWLYQQVMLGLEWLLLSHHDGDLVMVAQQLSPWRRFFTPAVGGAVAGLILWSYQSFLNQRPSAPVDYIEAVDTGDGRLDVPASLTKVVASLLVVVSGSAIGREGAMILLAVLVAYGLARKFAPRQEWKLWIACGAAAGMAGVYHAPLAGSLFVAEILFGSLTLASVAPVVVAAVTSLLVSIALSDGQVPLYVLPDIGVLPPLHMALLGITGILSGVIAPGFLWLLEKSAAIFAYLKLLPPLQLALGGLIVGGLSVLSPEVWGNGGYVVQLLLADPPTWHFLVLILLYKLLAVLASSGSGAPGGVFTPTLFVGAGFGAILGHIAHGALGVEHIPAVFTLAGMGTFLAATTHAPIMATVMICELTGQYTMLPAMMLACVLATMISRVLHRRSVYR